MGCSASKDVLDQTQPHHHVQYLSSKIAGGSSVYAKLGRSASTTSLPLRHHHHRRGDNNNNSNVKSPGVVDNTSSCCSSYHVVILTSSSYGLLTMDHHQQQQSLQQPQQQQSLLQYHHHQHLAEKQVENGGGILQVPSTASCQASATDLVVDERMSSADENYLVKNFDIVPPVDLVKVMMMMKKKKKKKKNPKLLLVSEVDEEVEMPAESINLLELMDGLEEGGGEEEEDMSEWSAAADFSDQELEISPPVESSPAEEALLQMVVECEEKKPSDHRHDQGTNPLTAPAPAAPAPAAGGGSTKLKPSPASTSPGADARQARQAAASKAAAASVRPGLSKPPRYPVKLQPPKLVPAESDSTIAAAKASESSSIGNELETNRQNSATREDHFWTEELECTIHESDGLLEAFERELEQFLNNSKEEEEEWYCKVGNKSEDGEENSEAAKYHSDQALLLQLPGAADTTTTTTTIKRNKIIEDCGAGKKLQQEGETVVMKAEQPASWEEEDFFWQEADEQKLAPLYTSSTAITSGAVAQGITKIFQDCTHVKFILQRMGISIDELATLVEEEEAGSLPSQNSPREASSL